jgi:hypothetical protein
MCCHFAFLVFGQVGMPLGTILVSYFGAFASTAFGVVLGPIGYILLCLSVNGTFAHEHSHQGWLALFALMIGASTGTNFTSLMPVCLAEVDKPWQATVIATTNFA